MKYYAGIDLGGTKIYSIVINEKGKILSREKVKTIKDDNPDNIIKRIVDCYKEVVKKSDISENEIEAVGMAVPSAVNIDKGILIQAPNLGWKNIELSKIMYQKLKKPFFLDNDVNMGTFGEYIFSFNKEFKNLFGIFIGTGIGGGYIVDGQIVRGQNYTAGEIGHMIMKLGGPKCGCGRLGCFEAISGKVGIINYMKKMVTENGEKTLLDEISPEWQKNVGSSALKKCFEKNDKIVVKALTRSAEVIGIACANLINLIGIEAIILGGGIIEELGDVFMPIIKKYAVHYSIGNGAKGVNLLQSKLGDDAVALGSAWSSKISENQNYLFKG